MITKKEKVAEIVKKFEDKRKKIMTKYEEQLHKCDGKKETALMKIGVNPAYTCEDCNTVFVDDPSFLEFPKYGTVDEDCVYRIVVCRLCGKVNYFKLDENGEDIDKTMKVTDSVVRVKYNPKDFKGTGIHMPVYFKKKSADMNAETSCCDEHGHIKLYH